MVDPTELATKVVVPDPVKIRFNDPYSNHLRRILGASGRRMAEQGFAFHFTRESAEFYIKEGIAFEVE